MLRVSGLQLDEILEKESLRLHTYALRVGMRADFAHWRVRQPAELVYWLGGGLCAAVFSGGNKVA